MLDVYAVFFIHIVPAVRRVCVYVWVSTVQPNKHSIQVANERTDIDQQQNNGDRILIFV